MESHGKWFQATISHKMLQDKDVKKSQRVMKALLEMHNT